MTEDVFILDCHSESFVWIGQQVDSKVKMQALDIGQKFLEHDFLLERPSQQTPIFIIMEENESPFFTRFFNRDSAKSTMHGNSFQRKLAIVKNGVTPIVTKPRRQTAASYGRSGLPDKPSQRLRSMSSSPNRPHKRGRLPAFNALPANFVNPNARNLSIPPPLVRKPFPKFVKSDQATVVPRLAAIAALSASFEPA